MKLGGFVKSYRRKWDNPVFRSKQEAAVWAWMCDMAQWKDTRLSTKYGPVDLKRGEILIAERQLADDFGLHRNTIRQLIQRMVDDSMITLFRDRCPYHAGTIAQINNYDSYQCDGGNDEDDKNQSRTDGEADSQPIEDRSRTKNNEDNKLNEEKVGGAGAPPYAFVGKIIKLKSQQFDQWRQSYRNIDIVASLQAADDYYSEHPPPDGKWFFPVSNWLRKDNTDAAARKKEATRGDDWW